MRDLLIELSSTDLFRAKWSERIHDEWINNLLENRPDLNRDKLNITKSLMNAAVMDCLVTDFEAIEASLSLPDINDNHVLAAAIVGKADAIITRDIKDFPVEYVKSYDIEIIDPDDFLKYQFEFDPAIVLNAVRKIRSRLKNPPVNAKDHLTKLERLGLPKIVSELRKFETMI